MREVVRQGPLQWGMAWGEWLTFHDERRSQYGGWWVEAEVPDGITMQTAAKVASALVERHEGLRTTFEADDDGRPLQRVWGPATPVVRDLRNATAEELQAYRTDDFMVDEEWPCRFALAPNAAGSTVLLSCISHIAVDNRAKELLWNDLQEILLSVLEERPPKLEPVECQPLDYALYQQSERTRARRERAKSYWLRELDRVPVATYGVGEIPEYVRYVVCQLDSRTAAMQLGRVANRIGLPVSAVFAAVYAVALATATAKDRVPLDLSSHGRITRSSMNVAASLAGGVVLSVELVPGQSFADLAARIHLQTLEAMRHSLVDIMEYTEWRTVSSFRRGGEIGCRSALNFTHRQEGGTVEAPAESDVAWDVAVGDPIEYRGDSHNLYLAASGGDGSLKLYLTANDAVFGGRHGVEALATSMTAILALLDTGEASDVRSLRNAVAGLFSDSPYHEPGLASARGDSVRSASIDLALKRVAGVNDSRTLITEDGEIVTTVESADGSLTEAELLTLLRAQRGYRETLRTVPDRILITAAEPSDSPVERESAESAIASTLAECVRTVNNLPSVDPRSSYADSGGRFFLAPAVLRRLRELGYEGLNRNDMQLPCSLTVLAQRLHPSPPAEKP